MTVEYQKVWTTMNDLEMVTSKICSAREIIDSAAEAIQSHDYNKAETLAMAAYEFLEYYLQDFDEKFKLAWQATVGDLRDGDMKEDNKSWNSFWEGYYPEEPQQYTEEELNAMCDKAELDAEIERIRQEGGYEWTPETKKTLTYDEAVAAGWEMTDDGIWMPPQKQNVQTRWILPVQEAKDMDTDETEYFVSFPQDLLDAADLKEGDAIHWIDNNDGSYTIRKPLGPDEC